MDVSAIDKSAHTVLKEFYAKAAQKAYDQFMDDSAIAQTRKELEAIKKAITEARRLGPVQEGEGFVLEVFLSWAPLTYSSYFLNVLNISYVFLVFLTYSYSFLHLLRVSYIFLVFLTPT